MKCTKKHGPKPIETMAASAVLFTTFWLNKCLIFLHLISSPTASFAWVLSSLSSSPHFERPGPRLWLFSGRNTRLAPSQLLVLSAYLQLTTLCFFQNAWEMTVFQLQGFQLDQNYLTRQRKTSSEKEHNACSQHPPSISHPQIQVLSMVLAASCTGALQRKLQK